MYQILKQFDFIKKHKCDIIMAMQKKVKFRSNKMKEKEEEKVFPKVRFN